MGPALRLASLFTAAAGRMAMRQVVVREETDEQC